MGYWKRKSKSVYLLILPRISDTCRIWKKTRELWVGQIHRSVPGIALIFLINSNWFPGFLGSPSSNNFFRFNSHSLIDLFQGFGSWWWRNLMKYSTFDKSQSSFSFSTCCIFFFNGEKLFWSQRNKKATHKHSVSFKQTEFLLQMRKAPNDLSMEKEKIEFVEWNGTNRGEEEETRQENHKHAITEQSLPNAYHLVPSEPKADITICLHPFKK